jgi:general secretion pathway protein B
MSLILDALRKSEHSRQQSLTGRLGTADVPPAPNRAPVPWAAVIGVLLLINAAALVVLFWRGAPPPAMPVMPPAPPAAASPSYRPNVRPLAGEAPVPAALSPAAQVAPAVATTPSAAIPTAVPAAVPNLDSLPADFQHALPALHLDVHAYVDKAAERFVIINLQRYRIGDTLAEGPRVVDIVPQGVILEYRGTTFLLPRA